jgi:FMN phosphatase YigB (HAD superfamily)
MPKTKAVIFDFDGVLCQDYFYTTVKGKYEHVRNFIEENVFGDNKELVDEWMRGEKSSREINMYIARETNIDYLLLENLFKESVKKMKIDHDLLEFARRLKSSGLKIALVTNNMDVFNDITIPHNKLNLTFPAIVNSCNFGCLKHEKSGLLFDVVLKKIQHKEFESTLLIDDSDKACEMFKNKGGQAYKFINKDCFLNWSKNNIT